MNLDEGILEKGQIEREHLERVKEHMAAEEESIKTSRVIKGADTKNYKKFKNGQYIPPPEKELSEETKLKLARMYQILAGFMGFLSLGIAFFIIHYPPPNLLILENSVIVFKVYNSTLYLLIFKNYFVMEMDLTLLGCVPVAMGIIGIIYYQHKHNKISDRISKGQSFRTRTKKAKVMHQILAGFIGLVGLGMIFYSPLDLSIFENFIIVLSIYDSTLHLSIFKHLIIKMNLILLGFTLVVAGVIIRTEKARRTARKVLVK